MILEDQWGITVAIKNKISDAYHHKLNKAIELIHSDLVVSPSKAKEYLGPKSVVMFKGVPVTEATTFFHTTPPSGCPGRRMWECGCCGYLHAVQDQEESSYLFWTETRRCNKCSGARPPEPSQI